MSIRGKNRSTGNLFLQSDAFKQPKKELVENLLRSKIFTYTHFRIKNPSHLTLSRKKSKKREKIISSGKQMPEFTTVPELIALNKEILYSYREKIEFNFDEGFYFLMKLLKIAVDFESLISGKVLQKEKSCILPAFMLLNETMFELGQLKLAFYFGNLSVLMGHIYRDSLIIGKALLIMGRTSRKSQRFRQAILLLKKALEYFWIERSPAANDYEIETYSQLSYNFLQSNQHQESKIFAQKYQIGYLQPQDSKILNLSKELVTSLNQRISTWHKFKLKTFELVVKMDLPNLLDKHQYVLKGSIDHNQIFKLFQVNYDLQHEGFMKHEMFFYEIPLPLELKKNKLAVISKKINHSSGARFIPRNRAKSLPSIKVFKQNEKVEEKIILNYRGVGISKKKLTTLLSELLELFQSTYNSEVLYKHEVINVML